MTSISHRTLTTLFIIPLVLALLLSLDSPVRGSQTGISSFSKTYDKYQQLCRNLTAGRGQWLQIIRSFASVQHRASAYTRSRGLFLAGKASLILYAREGRVEDLDSAIRYFNEVKRMIHHKTRLVAILRELKAAHRLRRNHFNQRSGLQPNGNHRLQAQSRDRVSQVTWYHGRRSVDDVKDNGQTAKSPPIAVSAPGTLSPRRSGRDACDLPRTSHPQRLSDVYQGNPFCPVRRIEPARVRPRVKTVSLPRSAELRVAPAAVRRKRLNRPFIVVIDPGHGGKDPGAVSSDGTLKEKDITLSISRRLKKRLAQKIPGIKIRLTRTGDRFLTVTKRTAAANSFNADLFISIHCNSYRDSSAHGIETYYLSKAGSAQAMRVAARENDIPLSKMNDVEATLLDLMMTSKKSESEKLAETVHEALVRITSGHRFSGRDRGVKRGPFYVLLGATMPAILVECGYVSNQRDGRRLRDKTYQDSIARAIASGVKTYLTGLGSKG